MPGRSESATPAAPGHQRCRQCGTELAPELLACPLCGTLVHAAALRELATAAQAHEAEGALVQARDEWQRALALLPPDARQHAVIGERVTGLSARIATQPRPRRRAPAQGPWWRRGAAAAALIGLFALGKLKFLLLGLSKASTLLSMFAFFGVYWNQFGWALAAGLVVGIYIHEMGHVAALKRLGIAAGAPFFIPGVGALVLLKQQVENPADDARIGLAGPLWGLGAGLLAYGLFFLTRAPVWSAIAHLTGIINLFNLIPVWQLDGARGFHALARGQRWVLVAALATAYLLTNQGLLLIIAALALWRALQPAPERPDRTALATFLVLVAALSWLATVPAA